MKIFRRTSFFWFFVLVIFLFISGFGGIMSPIFNQSYLENWVPSPVYDSIYAKGQQAGEANCPTDIITDNSELILSTTGTLTTTMLPTSISQAYGDSDLLELKVDIQGLRDELKTSITEAVKTITAKCSTSSAPEQVSQPSFSEEELAIQRAREQAKAELQDQIETLQKRMETI